MKRLLSLLIGCLLAMHVPAQDMASVFVQMPDSIEPLLTKVNREDCVDFLASNMKAVVKNRFDRPAELTKLTGDYLHLQVTESSTMELKLLPLKDSVNVICLVKTVCAPACDSQIRFFTTDWEELGASDYLTLPSENVFFLPADSVDGGLAEARQKADACFMKLSLSPESPVLTLAYTTPDYLNKEDREKLMPYLRKENVVLQWRNRRFSM